MLDLPHLAGVATRGEPDVVARIMADEYVKGASVQQISAQSGYSTARVYSLLAKAGAELRERE